MCEFSLLGGFGMTLRKVVAIPLITLVAVLMYWAVVTGQGIAGLSVIGYADRLSIQPGETIRFMVSSEHSQYRADIVRLIHADRNPNGPGFREEEITSSVSGDYAGQHQDLPNGSYVNVPDSSSLHVTDSITLQAWIAPTTPQKGVQGIVTKWSDTDRLGYGLMIDEEGALSLWLGATGEPVQRVSTKVPLRASIAAARYEQMGATISQMGDTTSWYFVAATFDAGTGMVRLYQEPVPRWPDDPTQVVVEQQVPLRSIGENTGPLFIAAAWHSGSDERPVVSGHFNGKIEQPRVFDRALTRQALEGLQAGGPASGPLAAWDFSLDISSRRVSDTGPHGLHGRTVNMPTRAMTGHNWSATEQDFTQVPTEYGAIHFHDDDLDDAKWDVAFEYQVPAELKSGVYAARLRAGNTEDYIPFFVRPMQGTATAPIAFLVPTFSYLAYANFGSDVPQLLSIYDHHTDGSGVTYSSYLRPILHNLKPGFLAGWGDLTFPHQFVADTHLLDWMEAKNFTYDVITDGDLDVEGKALLDPYQVIVTGSHPEYWSAPMIDGLRAYLTAGGRLMYLGGNGFYWITSMDSEERHTVEVRRSHGTAMWDAAPGERHHSTTGEPGGLWRFRGRPPQQYLGVGFTAQGGGPGRPFIREPESFDPHVSWIFEGIGSDEPIGDFPSLVMEYGAAGFEIDRVEYSLGTPAHTIVLATASGFSDRYQRVTEEIMLSDSTQGGSVDPLVRADMTFIDYPNGGAVFSAPSISWDGSLSYNDYTNTVSRVTENVLRRFASDETLPSTTTTR